MLAKALSTPAQGGPASPDAYGPVVSGAEASDGAAHRLVLAWSTPPSWFAAATHDLAALLSDHLHCERKAAENALSLVRRYSHIHGGVEILARLCHEETSHVVQVAALMAERGLRVRSDTPNLYARGLTAFIRSEEPGRLVDELLVGAAIEARSHERLALLADGFRTTGEALLADFYDALARAEGRHAEIFIDLAERVVAPAEVAARLAQLVAHEATTAAALPALSRIH